MPEATVNKYHRFVFGQNKVGFSRQAFVMKFIPETLSMQKLPDLHFRFCVLAFDPAHIETSGYFVMDICHIANL
jgi:hypothetical protein